MRITNCVRVLSGAIVFILSLSGTTFAETSYLGIPDSVEDVNRVCEGCIEDFMNRKENGRFLLEHYIVKQLELTPQQQSFFGQNILKEMILKLQQQEEQLPEDNTVNMFTGARLFEEELNDEQLSKLENIKKILKRILDRKSEVDFVHYGNSTDQPNSIQKHPLQNYGRGETDRYIQATQKGKVGKKTFILKKAVTNN